jgi:drug/metabolite transporter (DMT)-like permease
MLGFAFAVMCLVWGSTWLVIKEGARDLPPFTAAAARFVLAWLVMTIVARPLARLEGGTRAGWDLIAITGCLQFFASYAIVYWSETVLSSGLTAVLWAVYPLVVGLVSLVMLPGERFTVRQWLGFGLGFVGIATLFWTDLRDAGTAHVAAGAVLLLSPLVVAIANAYVRLRGNRVSAVLLNRDGLMLGAGLLLVLALVVEGGRDADWTTAAMFTVGYLAVFGTCLTFSLYFWVLRHMPMSTIAVMSYITPVIALTLGAVVGGEEYSVFTGVGTMIVLAGVFLARRQVRPPPRQ